MIALSSYCFRKNIYELTDSEKHYFSENCNCLESLFDYKSFTVQYKKSGEICMMKGYDLTDEKMAELERLDENPSCLDIASVAYCMKTGHRIPKNVRSKFTNSQIRAIGDFYGK